MSDQKYYLPKLDEEFIFQLTFCMEDQSSTYLIDLEEHIIINEYLELNKDLYEDNPQRFISIPDWTPSDGFRTMEKFVSTLKNEHYREKLRRVLQSGKGVFRQFKDVLSEQSALENLWYDFKDREIRRTIFRWYEENGEALDLSDLPLEIIDERPDSLIREDFFITEQVNPYLKEVEECKEFLLNNNKQNSYLYNELKSIAYSEQDYLILLTNEKEFVGVLGYQINDNKKALIKFYFIKEDFRGLGLFHFLFDNLLFILKNNNIEEVVFKMVNSALKIEKMFANLPIRELTKTIEISVNSLNDKGVESEEIN